MTPPPLCSSSDIYRLSLVKGHRARSPIKKLSAGWGWPWLCPPCRPLSMTPKAPKLKCSTEAGAKLIGWRDPNLGRHEAVSGPLAHSVSAITAPRRHWGVNYGVLPNLSGGVRNIQHQHSFLRSITEVEDGRVPGGVHTQTPSNKMLVPPEAAPRADLEEWWGPWG